MILVKLAILVIIMDQVSFMKFYQSRGGCKKKHGKKLTNVSFHLTYYIICKN